MSSSQPDEKWLGFYTFPRFWAGDALDVSDAKVEQNFVDSMSAITYSFSKSGVAIRIRKDGMILLRSDELEERISKREGFNTDNPAAYIKIAAAIRNEYLSLFNVFYFLLDCSLMEIGNLAHFQFSEITNRDLSLCIYENGQNPIQLFESDVFATQSQIERRPESDPDWSKRLMQRPVIDERIFQHCFDRFIHVIGNKQNFVQLSDLAKSLSEYKTGNYPISLVNAWFVCEREISDRWQEFFESRDTTYDDNRKRINAKRRKLLTGRDFTASVMSNILELIDVFTNEDLQTLNEIRQARNNIAHNLNGENCDAKICRSAIEIASRLVLEKESFKLQFNFSYFISGF
jgi:hypothetical protein